MAPLLSEASVHANTSGVFKGFHKNPETASASSAVAGKTRFYASSAGSDLRCLSSADLITILMSAKRTLTHWSDGYLKWAWPTSTRRITSILTAPIISC